MIRTPTCQRRPYAALTLALWVVGLVLPSAPAEAVEPESELEGAWGEALLTAGDAGAAVEALERALETDPSNERARLLLARALVAANDPEAALEHIEILLEAHPGDAALMREQGWVMLVQGDLMWAAQVLKQAAAADPDDELASLYLGYVALALDSPEDAVDPLEAAGEGPGPIGSSALYLEAVAHARGGDAEAALDAVQAALEMGLVSDPWAAAAKSLERDMERRLVPFDIVDFSLSAAGQYDSNVALFTEDILNLQDGRYDSAVIALAGSLTFRPFRGRLWALGVTGSAFQTFNLNDRVEAYNSTVLGGNLEFVRLFERPLPLSSIRIRYLTSLVGLWGGELVDFDHWYRFSESFGGDLAAEFREGDWGVLRAKVLYRYSIFTDYGRDNMGFTAGLNQTVFLWERRIKLALEASLRVEHASNVAWNQLAPRVFLGMSILGPWELQWLAALSYEHEDHLHSGPETRWGERRIDDVIVVNAGVSRTFLDQLSLAVSFTYIHNISTIALSYDYDRWVLGLNVAWRLRR